MPEVWARSLRDYVKADEDYHEANKNAEYDFRSPSCSLAQVFRRSTKDLESLSRYEITVERRLRNAMQDLERLQAARKAEAAEAATVIDITDMADDES